MAISSISRVNIGFIIVALLIIIPINFLIANEFYRIATWKGYSEKKYLWLPFLLGIIGYLLVIALPYENKPIPSYEERNPDISDNNQQTDSDDLDTDNNEDIDVAQEE